MVKIRYSELPAGLHVSAEHDGRDTIIYLQPGLTPEQRRAALVRVRSSARMGHWPGITSFGMAVAVSADKLRTTVRNGAAAMRGHPLLLLPPLILLVSGAIIFVLMSFVTLTVPQHDRAQSWAPSVVVPSGSQSAHGRSSRQPGGQLVVAPSGSGSGPAGHGGRRPQPTANPTPTPSGSASPIPVVSSPAPSAPATSGTPSPTPDPSPSPSESQSGTCVKLGPLGLCLTL